jgi:ketosteroid isomerase-like protein
MGGASETMKYVEVLRKGADGKWRYVVDMFSGVAAPAAAAAREK